MANALANAGLFVSTAFWGGALALTISDNLISVSRVKNGVLRPVHEAAAVSSPLVVGRSERCWAFTVLDGPVVHHPAR